MITEYTTKDAHVVSSKDPKHNSSVSNSTMTYKHDRSGSNPMIMEYTAKGDTAVVTLDVNAKIANIRVTVNLQI